MNIYDRNGKIMNTRKVYKIVNNINDEIYVGSTKTTLAKRFWAHKQTQRQKPERNNLYRFVEQNGWQCCRIILIEEFPCENKQQQLMNEQYWIDQLKPSMNKMNAFGQICAHNRRRSQCKDCEGGHICEHDRIRSKCKDCEGGHICEHNKHKSQCKDCNNWYCEYCEKNYSSKSNLYRHIRIYHFNL